MILKCPISVGEAVDKLTILRIKHEKIKDPAKKPHIEREKMELEKLLAGIVVQDVPLEKVNRELWDIEDKLREHEAKGDFGAGFVALARSVYKLNDKRFALKKAINEKHGSTIMEVKSYKGS